MVFLYEALLYNTFSLYAANLRCKLTLQMKTRWFKIWGMALLIGAFDQMVKYLAGAFLKMPIVLLPWLSLRYEQNTGIAWSIALPYELLIGVNFILLAAIFYFSGKYFDLRFKITQVALVLVLGGALGNLYDRLAYRYVIDYIALSFWPVFNLADAFLTIGIFLIIGFYGKIIRK